MQESPNNEIIIELSKTKTIYITIGAIGFVLAGLWLWSVADVQARYEQTTGQ
ncbi:MAG: hypothetical protein DHS20C17_22990 [Cyclobacteriaceae bacterium]|nr:MAG: hypothetical protein DHS20C17_22990 [Cyclobacteriaceae bacterium]